MNEEIFWKHYFTRVYFLRYKSGIDDPTPIDFLDSLSLADVVFRNSSPERGERARSHLPAQAQAIVDAVDQQAAHVAAAAPHQAVRTGTGEGSDPSCPAAEDSDRHAAESAALAAEVIKEENALQQLVYHVACYLVDSLCLPARYCLCYVTGGGGVEIGNGGCCDRGPP
jgi:hypothetical protein